MIRKLQRDGYLKRYNSMTAEERKEYSERVGHWLQEGGNVLARRIGDANGRLQNVLTVSVGWNDAECRAFEEGAVLLSARVGASDVWLPDMLYVKSAKRCIRHIISELKNVTEKPEKLEKPEESEHSEKSEYSEKPEKPEKPEKSEKPSAVPVRPKHIDQYVHLLPKKTQEHAGEVQGLLRQMDDAREKMRLLTDAKGVKGDDLARWAKLATDCDNRLRAIYKELDAEWEKLVRQGRVVVDDLGNARVVGTAVPEIEKEEKSLTHDEKVRRRELRKWLGDTRRGNGHTRDTHVRKWKEYFREYLTLEGDSAYEDKKIREAAAHYGIDMGKVKH